MNFRYSYLSKSFLLNLNTTISFSLFILVVNQVGIFLIRFSDSKPGQIAISYTDYDTRSPNLFKSPGAPTPDKIDTNVSRNLKRNANQSYIENKVSFDKKIIVCHCLVDSFVDGLKLTLANTTRQYDSLKDLLVDCKLLKFLFPLIPKSMLFESIDKLQENLCTTK